MSITGKLITPVQYEQGFEGLNTLRPLSLTDTVRRVVSVPIVNANPVDKPRIARGKFLRCSQQGAMLGTIPRSLTLRGQDVYTIGDDWQHRTYNFSHRIVLIYIYVLRVSGDGSVRWWNEDYDIIIQDIMSAGCFYWPFNGFTLYIGFNGYGEGSTKFYIYWFS